jgi:hypothetical protein
MKIFQITHRRDETNGEKDLLFFLVSKGYLDR